MRKTSILAAMTIFANSLTVGADASLPSSQIPPEKAQEDLFGPKKTTTSFEEEMEMQAYTKDCHSAFMSLETIILIDGKLTEQTLGDVKTAIAVKTAIQEYEDGLAKRFQTMMGNTAYSDLNRDKITVLTNRFNYIYGPKANSEFLKNLEKIMKNNRFAELTVAGNKISVADKQTPGCGLDIK